MGTVLITFRIMPESIDVPLEKLQEAITEKIHSFGGKVLRAERKPIAFGLTALELIFSMDEAKGTTDALEDDIKSLSGIMNVEVTDVRRAFG